jgi:hypothetical protein
MLGDILYLGAGTIGVWLLQTIKGLFKLEGRAMLWVSIIVSIILGAVVTGMTNPAGFAAILASPWLIFTGGSAVFATAEVIYKEMAKKFDLSVAGMVTAPADTVSSTATAKARLSQPLVVKDIAKKGR